MNKINWNKKYLTISLYVCAVLALTIIGVAICVYLPTIFSAIGRFFYIISPIFYGLMLAYLINPLLSLTEKRLMKYVDRKKRTPYIKRIICLIVTYVILCCIIALFGFLIFPQLIQNFDSISHNISTNISMLYEKIRTLLLNTFGISIGDASQTIDQVSNFIVNYFRNFGSKIGRVVFNFLVGLFLSFFILLHNENLRRGSKKLLASILPPRAFNATIHTVHMSNRIFGQFFIGKIFDSLIIGVITLAVLAFLRLPIFPAAFHMPYFLLIAAVICITNIIPYIGPIIGAVPCVLLVLIDNEGGFLRAFILLLIVIAIQTLDGNVIGPKILGKTIGISSLWVVVSIIVLGSFWGMFGMFIAVPLFTVIYNLVKDMTNKRLRKKNLPTETEAYAPQEKESAAKFSWESKEPPQPDPALLSDMLDENSMEDMSRKHFASDKNKGQKGGDSQ